MGGKRRESGLRALRRGAALGLALTALWIFGLTADLSGAWDALGRLGQTPSFVLGALSQELEGASAGDGLSPDLDRWGRLLLAQSALLSGGRPAVDAFLAEQAQAEEPPAEPIDQEENDQEEPELSPVQHGEVVEYTNLGKDDGSYLTTDQIYVKNSTQGQEVDVAALASQPVDLKLGAGPQILIVHTHGSEAYTQDEQDVYVESDPYRTTDCTKTWSGWEKRWPRCSEARALRWSTTPPCTTTPPITGPMSAPARGWRSGWSSIPRSNLFWMSTGTPWCRRTGRPISW